MTSFYSSSKSYPLYPTVSTPLLTPENSLSLSSSHCSVITCGISDFWSFTMSACFSVLYSRFYLWISRIYCIYSDFSSSLKDPISYIRPSSIITILSARCTKSTALVTSILVFSFNRPVKTSSKILALTLASRAETGSSIKTISASW